MGRAASVVLAWSLCVAACGSRGPAVRSGFVDAPVADVASPVAGQVAAIDVREGDRVRRGQLLVRLDDRERAARVQLAEAELERARSALEEAQRNVGATAPTVAAAAAAIESARATERDAQVELERVETLARSGVAPQAELDAARARRDVASAAVAQSGASRLSSRGRVGAAAAAVESARAAVASAEASLVLARVQLSQSEIRSPVDGVVAELSAREGEWAAPGTAVVAVEDTTRQWVRIDVGETELGTLRVGMPAEVRVIAFPDRRHSGRVVEIGAQGEFAMDRDVRRGRPDVRTFRVRVALDRPSAELRPGMTAEVIVPLPEEAR